MNKSFAVFILVAWLTGPVVRADRVEIENGDRFTGQVKSLQQEKLLLSTDYAGDISIDWPAIQALSTAEPLVIELIGGDSFTGRIELAESDRLEIATESGVMMFAKSDVKAILPVPEPQDYGFFDHWRGGVQWGVALSRGNTSLSSVSFSVDPVRETPKDRIALRYSSLTSREDGVKTANVFEASGRYDRFFSEKTFFFVKGNFRKDERASLDYRFRESGGFGYQWSLSEVTRFSFLGGLGVLQERYEELSREVKMEGVVGAEFETGALSPLTFNTRSQLSPFLSVNRYLFDWIASVSLPLWGKLRFGFEVNETYDSDPPEGTKKNDVRLLSTLGWTF